MPESIAISRTNLGVYSRNNALPVYADTVSNVTYIGLNTRSAVIPVSTQDQTVVLDSKYAFRPDLLSYKYYRSPLLGWYVCTANGIVDPFDPDTGLYPGRAIRIPSIDYINRKVI